jgi:hypothetical protein
LTAHRDQENVGRFVDLYTKQFLRRWKSAITPVLLIADFIFACVCDSGWKDDGLQPGKAFHLLHVHSQFENQYSCDISGPSALRRSDWYGRRQESVGIGDAFNEAENDLAVVAEVRESARIQKSRLRRGFPRAYMHYVKHEAIRQF